MSPTMEHTYSQFDTDLHRLRSASTTMAGLVEQQFHRAVEAVINEDLGLVAQVLARITSDPQSPTAAPRTDR